MGSEKVTLPNMGMDLPVNGVTTSPYTLAYLISSLQKVDTHDHSSGKGARLSQSSVQVTANWVMSGYGFTSTKFVGFSNPTTLTDAPNASAYFKNGDFYLKLGGGTELQVTKDNSLNASLIGGFTGDYATAQAFCSYDEFTNTYAFNSKITDTDTLSNVVVGALEIRSTTQDKNVFGFGLNTTGDIAATYAWTVPDTQASADSFININSSGVISYYAATKLKSIETLLDTSAPDAFALVQRNASGVVVASTQSTAAKLPSGTIVQRPTGANGLIRYNTDESLVEVYSEGDWGSVGGATTIIDWESGIVYKIGNIVTYKGVQWRVLSKHTSGASFDLTKVEAFENGVKQFTQSSHGFVALDVVRFSSGQWVKAQADIEDNLADPPAVIWMVQGDIFVVVSTSRDLYIQGHGLTEDTYFLSDVSAGALVATSPMYSNPIIGVRDADNVHLLNYRPQIVNEEVSFGRISLADDVDTTGRADGDSLVWNATTEKYEPVTIVNEAPIDGKQYARKDAGWNEVAATDTTDTRITAAVAGGLSVSINTIVEMLTAEMAGNRSFEDAANCVFESANSTYISVSTLDSSKAIVCYQDGGNSSYGTACVLSISGTTITAGTPVVFESATSTYISVSTLDSSKAIVCYRDDGNSSYGTACVLSISGTTITAGTPVVFESATSTYISVSTLDSSKAIVCYTDDGNSSYGTACVLSISGTTITAGTPVVFESASSYYISVSTLDSSKAIVCYRDDGNSSYGTSSLLKITGASVANKVNPTKTGQILGYATTSGSTTVTVALGPIVKGRSGLIAGRTYYVSSAGIDTVGAIRIGVALSSTELYLRLPDLS